MSGRGEEVPGKRKKEGKKGGGKKGNVNSSVEKR